MSFAADVRRELAHTPEERREGALSELCAAVLGCGGLSFKGPGRYGLQIHAESQEQIQRHTAMLKRFLGVDAGISMAHTDRLGGHTYYVLSPDPQDVQAILAALDLLDPDAPFGLRGAPSAGMLEADCQRRAFLRGAFLVGGSVSNPEKAYHLEIAAGGSELMRAIARLMEAFSLPVRTARRKSQYLAYLKGAESVADMLRLMGAHRALMLMENVRIVKGVRNDVNRQVNCDQNNLDKVVAAAEKQISMIRALEKRMGLDALPLPLQEIAELRLRHPDATLTELGAMASPAIGKSGVNARMRKLELLAEEAVNRPPASGR